MSKLVNILDDKKDENGESEVKLKLLVCVWFIAKRLTIK